MVDTQIRLDFDILWKEIIGFFIEDFVAFFMHDLYPKVDFKKKPDFWDKELDKIFGDGKQKDVRHCDKLVRLHLKNGKDCWILVHIEVQKERNHELPKRMFRYFYRISDKYEEETSGIEAIAILLSNVGENKYDQYVYEYGETKLVYNYRTYPIFSESEEDLLKNKNPFSIVILASRYAIQHKEEQQKASFKFKLAKLAFGRGYTREVIIQLLTFVYFVIELPDEDEKEFEDEMRKKIGDMETQSLTFQQGQDLFLSRVFGADFDINFYISKERYNTVVEEKEQARREKEQAKREKEQARKKEVQERTEKIQAKKEKIAIEAKLLNTIIGLAKRNFSVDEIADLTHEKSKKIVEILKEKKLVE